MAIKNPLDLKLALVQSRLHWQDKAANFKHFEKLLPQTKGAHLTLLPEMFSTGFSMKPQALFDAENGETLAWMQHQAKAYQTALCGSAIIKTGAHYYNQLFFVKPGGQYQTYRKRHLFTLAGEEKVYRPGRHKLVLNYRGWRINPQICYDLRFPAWCRNQEGFDVQLFVANWPARRSFAWQSLLTARAIENQCYVAGLNRVGPDGNGVEHSGDSCLIDPLGKPIWEAPAGKETVKTLTLSYANLAQTRQRFAFLNDQDSFLIT
jgi:predicted amidohydrolase